MTLSRLLITLGLLLTASACNNPAPIFHSFPPVEDTRVVPKPTPGPEILEDEQAAALYDSLLEAWGDEGWARVKSICEDAVRKGARYPAGWCDGGN